MSESHQLFMCYVQSRIKSRTNIRYFHLVFTRVCVNLILTYLRFPCADFVGLWICCSALSKEHMTQEKAFVAICRINLYFSSYIDWTTCRTSEFLCHGQTFNFVTTPDCYCIVNVSERCSKITRSMTQSKIMLFISTFANLEIVLLSSLSIQ